MSPARLRRVGPPLLAAALAFALPVRAEPLRLDEPAAVAAAQGRDELRDAAEGSLDAARAEADEAGLWPNPTFEYERDRTKEAGGGAVQDTYRLSQPVDMSGRRALRRDAALHRTDAAQAEGRLRMVEAGAEARRLFHTVLMRAQSLEAAQGWAARLGEAEAVLTRLRQGREVSGYDARRLSREKMAADAKVRAMGADLAESWERLRVVMGLPAGSSMPRLEGRLLPPPPLPLEELMGRLENRPDLQGLRARIAASDLERRAADRGWIPEVTVGAGLKQVDRPESRDQGVLLTVSTPLPLFDRGQTAARKAAAQSRAVGADLALARAKAEGEVRGLWRRAAELRDTAQTFRDGAVAPSRELARIAQAAYRAGEMNVLELLDAQKALWEAESTALELEFGAREAHSELILAAGEPKS